MSTNNNEDDNRKITNNEVETDNEFETDIEVETNNEVKTDNKVDTNEAEQSASSNSNSVVEVKNKKKLLEVKETDIIENNSNQSIETNNNSSLNFFSDDEEIEIEEKVVKEEHELTYDNDEIYLHDLENHFLSEYPIAKQSKRYIQEEALKKAEEILKLKNIGLDRVRDKFDNDIIKDYTNNNFNNSYIIPIVDDNMRKYRLIDGNNIITEDNVLQTDVNEFKDDNIHTDDQRIQFKKLHQLDSNKLEFKEYLKEVNNLIRPYLLKDVEKIDRGIKVNLNDSTQLLRYYNIQNINWENRVGIGGHSYNLTEKSEESGLYETERKTLTDGEQINIIGFLKLPNNIRQLYYKKHIDRYIKLNHITNIKYNEEDTYIGIKGHNLEEGDIILIHHSNGSPSLDGKHIVHKIKDKDTIILDIHRKGGKEGNRGDIYTLFKLSYRIHNIKKISNKWTTATDKTIINQSKNRPVADIYIFNSIIEKKEYQDVLREVVPTYKEILEDEKDLLDKCLFYNEIEDVLSKFNINIQDLDNDTFTIIKNILKSSSEKVQKNKSKTSVKENKNKQIGELLKDETNIYADKYIKSDIIVKYYGKYPLINTSYDNFRQRNNFIENQYDNGKLYYAYVLSDQSKELISKCNTEKLKKGIKELNKELDVKKDKLENEKKMIEYINKDNPNKYNSNEIKIEDLDIQKLQKYYFSNTCKNNTINRLETRIELLSSLYKKIGSIIKFSDSTYYNKYYKDLLNEYEQKLFRFLITESKVEKQPDIIIDKPNKTSKCKIVEIINKVTKLDDKDHMNYLIFKIIEKDGILIDNSIYSKTFKCKIICGHWLYLKKIINLEGPDRETLITRMYGVYGDSGKESTDKETCKYCGNLLGNKDYDAVEFNKNGKLKNPRQEWDTNDDEIKYITSHSIINYYKDIGTEKFKNMIVENGIKYSDIKIVENIANVIKDISIKIGIELRSGDFLDCIMDSYSNIIELLSFEKFKIKELLHLKTKGFDKEKIIQMDEAEYFKKLYIKTTKLKKISFIIGRILLSIQVAIPNYKRRTTLVKCVFNTFDGEEGFDYMACVVDSMKFLEGLFDKREFDEKIEKIRRSIIYCYRIYTNQPKLKKSIFLKKRHIEDNEIKEEIIPVHTKEYSSVSIKLPNNYVKMLKDSKDAEIRKLMSDYYVYTTNMSEHIIHIVDEYHKNNFKSKINMEMGSFIEPINHSSTYYTPIVRYKPEIQELMKESNKLDKYKECIKHNGVYSRINILNTFKYHISPPFPFISNHTDENIIAETLEAYCSTGDYEGEQHKFVGASNKRKCIKCNMNIVDINNLTMTEEEFQIFLDKIGKHHVMISGGVNGSNEDEHKKATHLDENINKLVNNIKKFNTDERVYDNDYIKSIGLYNNIYNIHISKDDKDKILTKEELYNKRVDLIKSYLNNYLRKYISLIKNQTIINRKKITIDEAKIKIDKTKIKVQFEPDKKILNQLEEMVYEENKLFHVFNEKNNEIFGHLKIKETIDYINNISYENNKYNITYDTIIHRSKYTSVDASNLLLNILVENLNNFYDVIQKNFGEEQLRTLTLFIIEIFDKIDKNNQFNNVSTEKSTSVEHNLENSISQHDSIEKSKLTEGEKHFNKVTQVTDENNELEDNDNENEIIELGKHKLGEDASEGEIQNFKNDYIEDNHTESQIEDEELEDGNEVIDENNEGDELDVL